jgi:hypothetical protein
LGLAAGFLVILTLLQFSTPNLAGNDGYYHIKFAEVMRLEGLKPHFEWLPLTLLNPDDFVDHHFLYHILLIPFTLVDLRVGVKLASVLFPAASFLMAWWLLRRQKVPYSSLWALGLLGISEAFLYRMSMPRAQALSLGVLVLALHWLLSDRHKLLMPLAFAYVWLYNAFPLILVVAGAYTAASWLQDRSLRWRPLVYAGIGVGLGLVLNPYFPENLSFIFHHVAPKLADPTATRVGSEWYPYETTQLLENSGPALVAFFSGVLALGLSDRRMDVRTGTSLLLALLFGAMLFQSRRFIEYLPPFALIFAAFAWAALLDRRRSRETPTGVSRGLGMIAGRWLRRVWPGLAGLLALLPALWLTIPAAQASLQNSKPFNRYAGAAGWLADNTPPGSRVFQTDWDDFPRLFYANTHNTYTLGLDPTYMQRYDAELYTIWVDLTQGRVERPAQVIRTRFGADYVFTDLNHGRFIAAARDDPGMVEVYRDNEALVYQIKGDLEQVGH